MSKSRVNSTAVTRAMLLFLSIKTGIYGADLSVAWTFEMTEETGLTSTPRTSIIQIRAQLTGSYEGRFGKSQLSGKVNRSAVTLVTKTTNGELKFHGLVNADGRSLSGTYKLVGVGNGTFTASKPDRSPTNARWTKRNSYSW